MSLFKFLLIVGLITLIIVLVYVVFMKIHSNTIDKKHKQIPEAKPFDYGFDVPCPNADDTYKALVKLQQEIKQKKKEGYI